MNSSSNDILLSIVIPTYNRSDLLAIALDSLTNQTFGGSNYEIIIVDNNSSDDTRPVAERYVQVGNVRYVLETEQGHSASRNRGWKEAKGTYVAYVDDDCKIPPGWLNVINEIILTKNPYCFGGPYFAYYLNEKPEWFKDSYGSNVHAERAGFLAADRFLSGGNIVFQKNVLMELNGFSTTFGMVGKKIGYADETELLLRLRAHYGQETLYFSPDVFVYHLVRPEKMKWRWIIKRFWTSGIYYQRMCLLSGKARHEDRVSRTLRVNMARTWRSSLLALTTSLGVFNRDRRQYPYFQNYLYERVLPHILQMGIYYETMRDHLTRRASHA